MTQCCSNDIGFLNTSSDPCSIGLYNCSDMYFKFNDDTINNYFDSNYNYIKSSTGYGKCTYVNNKCTSLLNNNDNIFVNTECIPQSDYNKENIDYTSNRYQIVIVIFTLYFIYIIIYG